MKKPLIGIVIDLTNNNDKNVYSCRPWYALRKDYSDEITKAGGIPVFLPYHKDVDEILDHISGLIIPGGDEDIHPKFYGQEIISDKVKTNDQRAEFELKLTQKALDRNMPIFGICNGMQLINVLLGGTLIQHIPDIIKSDINHEQPHPKDIPTHDVILSKNTLMHELAGTDKISVNTTHHQSIDELAEGLILSGSAPDGVIEAIESKEYAFLVGVQWHSEYANSLLDQNLFKKLVEKAKEFSYSENI